MYLKHIGIIVMTCFCSGVYTMQQEQSVAARILKNVLRVGKVTGAATKNLVGSGALWAWHKKKDFAVSGLTDAVIGCVLPKVLYALPEVLRFNDTQGQVEMEHDEDPGQFDVSKWQAFEYLRTFIQELPKHRVKDVLADISCDYGANVMHKASMRLLSDLHMLPHIPGPLIVQCFVAGTGNALLLAGMRDWFVQPCRQFGARVRRLGFSGACKSLLEHPSQVIRFNDAQKEEMIKHLHKMKVDKHFGQANLSFPGQWLRKNCKAVECLL